MPKMDSPPKTDVKKEPKSSGSTKGRGKKENKKPREKPIIYKEVRMEKCDGKNALNAVKCKELLGWIEDPDEAARNGLDPAQPLFKYRTYEGGSNSAGKTVNVWCKNNVKNRPFYMSNALTLMQEILNKRWAGPNGVKVDENGDEVTVGPEPIAISRTGQVHNGQHQMIACVLAENERTGPNHNHWEELWDDEILIDKFVCYGISDSDVVINTLDTAKPRSLTDVIYRSGLFPDLKGNNLRRASSMTDSAIKLLWHRLGLKNDAWAKRRTHSEAIDFVNRHSRILDATRLILNRNDDCGLGNLVPPGVATALMYLMAASATDSEEYHVVGSDVTEARIDFSNWEIAEDFWTKFIQDNPDLHTVREVIGWLLDEKTGGGGSLAEKLAVVCNAWLLFVNDEKITEDAIALQYDEHEDTGIRILRVPSVGGIDLGDPGGSPSLPNETNDLNPVIDDTPDDKIDDGDGEDDIETDDDFLGKQEKEVTKERKKGEPVFSPEERAAEVEKVVAMSKKGRTPPRPTLKPRT